MKTETLNRGFLYETCIRRAFNCDVDQHGAHPTTMTNLIHAEAGLQLSFLPKTERQFIKVKNYTIAALRKFMTWNLAESEMKRMLVLNRKADNALVSDELSDIITEALEITRRFI